MNPELPTCPACGKGVECTTPIGADESEDHTPHDGDVSICFSCGEILMYDDKLRLRLPSALALKAVESNAESWALIQKAQQAIRGRNYGLKCEAMAEQYRNWLAAHPDVPVLISFKIPEKVFIAIDLVGAISQGFMVVDDNGKRMLNEMGWLADNKDMPSLAMVRAVINHVQNPHSGRSASSDQEIV